MLCAKKNKGNILPGVSSGQVAKGGSRGDVEAGIELRESSWGKLGAARGKLEQARHLLFCKIGHCRPEPVQHLQAHTDGMPQLIIHRSRSHVSCQVDTSTQSFYSKCSAECKKATRVSLMGPISWQRKRGVRYASVHSFYHISWDCRMQLLRTSFMIYRNTAVDISSSQPWSANAR